MKLQQYQNKIQLTNFSVNNLVLPILKIEQILETEATNIPKIIDELGNVLANTMAFGKQHKYEINNKVEELDLDYWKNNVKKFQSQVQTIDSPVYLYSLRKSLTCLIDDNSSAKEMKSAFFEIMAKTFLFIDFLNLNIDSIIEKSASDKKKNSLFVVNKEKTIEAEEIINDQKT